MSDQGKTEQDIDEILASIDEMLSHKKMHVEEKLEKEALVQQASAGSATTLGLSSTPVHPDLIAEAGNEGVDDASSDSSPNSSRQENITSQHRILLTEALLAPASQEALPLWVEQAEAVDVEHKAQQEVVTAKAMPAKEEHTKAQQQQEDLDVPDEHVMTINRDQLEQLVEVISRDVSRQFTQHMQNLLPRLVSASLVRHLASLKKDTE